VSESESENARTGSPGTILDEVLHLSGGLSEADRPMVVAALSALVPHLSRWDADSMTVEVSVKDRDGKEQQVTLRADLAGYPTLVAKGASPSLESGLAEAKHDLIRQIEDEKKKRDPKSNRHLRRKTT
jgi:hypothetical protein